MSDNSVKLLQVTSTSEDADETVSNEINAANVFVKHTPVKVSPAIHNNEGNDLLQRVSVQDAWEDEAIIQSCLRLHDGKDKLSNYPLNEEEDKMAKKKIIRVWNTLFRFFSNTSLHGLPHIVGNKRSHCRMTLWIIVILISLGLMLWAVIAVTIQYAEKNTVLFSKRHYNERLKFPAVTICNKNLYRKSVARNTHPAIDINEVLLNDKSRDSLFAGIGNNFGIWNTDYLNDSGHQLQEMLFYCHYGRRKCTRHQFIQKITTSGNCYTFNSGENGSTVLYSIDGGYQFGLELILNAEQYEYFLADSDSVGFNVFIHDQGHFPYYGSLSISTGHSTQVALHKVNYKFQTPAGGGQCSNEISLKYFTTYSRLSCIIECVTDLVVGNCKCKAQGMPGPAQVCELRDLCLLQAIGEMFDVEKCDCPIACETTVYEKMLSYAKFPAEHIPLLMNNSDFLSTYPFPDFVISYATDDNGTEFRYLNSNFTESFLSNNFAKVFIYYDELISTTMEEGLEYSTFQFIADFGGHIGLFTGAGFLTLFEIMDLCYSLIRPIDE